MIFTSVTSFSKSKNTGALIFWKVVKVYGEIKRMGCKGEIEESVCDMDRHIDEVVKNLKMAWSDSFISKSKESMIWAFFVFSFSVSVWFLERK